MNKIYIFGVFTGHSAYGVIRDAEPCGDVIGYSVNDKGEQIASHWSSGVNWSKHDMGVTSDWKHDIYKSLYPDGYEIVYIGVFDTVEQAANELEKRGVRLQYEV